MWPPSCPASSHHLTPLLPLPLPSPPQTAFRGTAVTGDKVPVTFSNPSVNVDDTRNPSPTTPVVAPQAPPVVQKQQMVEGDKFPVTFSNPSVPGHRTPTPVVAPVVNQQEEDQKGGADKVPVTFSNPSVSVEETRNRQQVDEDAPKDVSKEQFSG